MANIFTIISKQVAKNLNEGGESKFSLKYYNGNVVSWLVRTKAFEIENVEYPTKDNEYKYTLTIKNINKAHNSLNMAIEQEEHKRIKRNKYVIENSEDYGRFVVNDIYRQELECPNWDEQLLEKLDMGREQLSKEDSCVYQLYLNSLGYENYEEYIRFKEKYLNTLEDEIEFEDNFNNFIKSREIDMNEYYI